MHSLISVLPLMLILSLAVGLLIWYVFFMRKTQSFQQISLFSISFILAGGVFIIDPRSNLYILGYVIVFMGLGLSISGFLRKE